jgi:hypothetical protein
MDLNKLELNKYGSIAPTSNPKNIVGDFNEVDPVYSAELTNAYIIWKPKYETRPV